MNEISQLAIKLKTFFHGRDDVFALQLKDGGYVPSKHPLRLDDFQSHLEGKQTIGIYLVTPTVNTVNFCAFDIDNYDDEMLRRILFSCLKLGIKESQLLLENSGNKGRHIFFRFEEPTNAKDARQLLKMILKYAEIDEKLVEIFPKQDSVQVGAYGNLIKLPLGIHNKSNRRSQFLDFNTYKPLENDIIHKNEFINTEQLNEIFTEFKCLLPKYTEPPIQINTNSDEHLCIDRILNGVSEGYRDICLFNLCIYTLKIKKLPQKIARNMLIEWNNRNQPPLPANEIDIKIEYILKNKYDHIACSDPKIKHFCEKNCPKLRNKEENKSESKSSSKKISFLNTENKIIELICSNEKGSHFAVFNKFNKEINYVNEFKYKETIYLPFSDDLVKAKTILLPSKVDEYGTINNLISEIKSLIYKYVELPDEFETLCAYYVVFSYIADCFDVCPYLRFKGDYNTGKSRALMVVGSLCYKATLCGGATTTSPIFRLIDQYSGTLVLDEADFRSSDATDEIMKILNTGYMKGSPVLRTETSGKEYSVRAFHCFSPKVLASRFSWKDKALESRCITMEMSGKNRTDIPFNIHPKTFENEALNIRNKLLMFRFDNYGDQTLDESEADHSLEPRLNQIMLPLMNMINDKETKTNLKKIMRDLNKKLLEDRNISIDCDILKIIISYFEGGTKEISLKTICNDFNRQYNESEKPITSRKLSPIISDQLQLEKKRLNGGIHIYPTYEKIEKLKKKYGLGEDV